MCDGGMPWASSSRATLVGPLHPRPPALLPGSKESIATLLRQEGDTAPNCLPRRAGTPRHLLSLDGHMRNTPLSSLLCCILLRVLPSCHRAVSAKLKRVRCGTTQCCEMRRGAARRGKVRRRAMRGGVARCDATKCSAWRWGAKHIQCWIHLHRMSKVWNCEASDASCDFSRAHAFWSVAHALTLLFFRKWQLRFSTSSQSCLCTKTRVTTGAATLFRISSSTRCACSSCASLRIEEVIHLRR